MHIIMRRVFKLSFFYPIYLNVKLTSKLILDFQIQQIIITLDFDRIQIYM